ncbi:putative transcription regulator mTERF family [Rosa chinensis]|uniref:Putative transcription regulator mTERF family n=1 Tax=Rosa chinensis TaxID=74649 RepID=A0A2P6SAL1_ROSCH|nr:putative transcription regulator mTERF family [Rosa chinensis]
MSMAPHSIFSKSLRFSLLLCRNRHPMEGFVSHLGRRLISNTEIPAGQDDSTVSYLVNPCGLSPEAAVVASHKVKLRSLVESDSVLALLKHYELSDAHISKAVRIHPHVLVANAQETLLPKLEFLCSIGMSRLDLAKTLTYNPIILTRSLKNCIIPCYTFLKEMG